MHVVVLCELFKYLAETYSPKAIVHLSQMCAFLAPNQSHI